MREEKIKEKIERKFLALAVFSMIFILSSLMIVSAATSTSVYSAQYFPPSVTGQFSSLMTGPFAASGSSFGTRDNGFFDMQLFIPPFGCQPYVVRSDLLEEQDVPVFCQLMPLKINPGVDITRIDSLSVVQKTSSPYISGVGFHPANAAIKSGSNMASTPSGGNIGYVVVVLKRIDAEKNMPNNVTVVLGAQLQYGATNTFGIEKNEFYLPVMTDEEFTNNQQDYTFYDGAGYIRAESVDANSARISVYGYNNQVIFSSTLQKGATSTDFYLPNNYGGQGIRITLEDITVPQTKARFSVNGQKLDVYVGQQFYDGKCRLSSVKSTGLGSGTATAVCNGVTFSNLQRKIVSINLETAEKGRQIYNLGDFVTSDNAGNDYYLVFTNRAKDITNSYVVLAKVDSKTKANLKSGDMIEVANALSNTLSGKAIRDIPASQEVNGISLSMITIAETGKDSVSGITFAGTKTSNGAISDSTVKSIYQDAINFYDKVKSDFTGETYPLDSHNPQHTYAEQSLWAEYNLATKLGQQADADQVLSRIFNEYPNSVNDEGQTATNLINSPGILADNSEARQYDAKNDLSIELLSVTEPSASDHSVNLGYSAVDVADNGRTKTGTKLQATPGSVIYSDSKQTVVLRNFDETSVTLDCSNAGNTGVTSSLTARIGNPAVFNSGDCKAKIFVNAINFKKVAQVLITPITNGRSRESNFTFSIGIEKRALGLNLTPAEANAKIAKLDKEIAKFQNISENLGKLIEGGKAACLATTAIINIKNLFSGVGGEASARTEVMKKWNEICSSSSYLQSHNYADSEACIAGEYDGNIEPQITATTTAMADYNAAEKKATDAANADKTLNPEQRQAKIKADILADLNKKLAGTVNGDCKINPITKAQECTTLKAQDILTSANLDNIQPQELSSLYVNLQLMSSTTGDAQKAYQDATYTTLKAIDDKVTTEGNAAKMATQLNLPASALDGAITDKGTRELSYTGKTWKDYSSELSKIVLDTFDPATPISLQNYKSSYMVLYILDNNLNIKEIRKIDNGEAKDLYSSDSNNQAIQSDLTDEEKTEVRTLLNVHFTKVDPTDYQNLCSNCDFAKIFSLEPFKGQPAMLPFDYQNGFYVQVKNDFPGLGTGNVASYQDSGKVNTFYLCNVGKNKLMEGYQVNDDTCRRFDFYTRDMLDAYPGLTKDQTKKKVTDALTYLNDAQKQLKANPSATTIKINGRNLRVQSSEGSTGTKCTDFMSPSDCQVIYNVCDPFVCPNSRCDFGGRYPVDNVISSGIIGSTLLCLPNFIGLSGNKDTGVAVPVCITGINAGLNSWIGILKSYRSCINESVTTGRTVGICDEIYSVYLCDMFWRQAGPLASALTKNLFLTLLGAGDHGGGEYLFVNDAWNNAAKSVANFENSYAKDSNLRFGFQDIASSVVADVCKLPVSATYPDNFKTMLEPELPVQFSAWFEELAYTSATVPATSQYNVFYQIYGGDQGHYYQVYLKSPPTSIGYIGKDSVVVASGYVDKGQTATETKNFIDTSGFKQLCVRIDAQDKCGFKSVSTSAALNYAKDKIVQDQATEQVTAESECIAGGHSLGSFLTPNIQQGAEEFINPELYNQGIIRVCSNSNPGQGTELSRWSDVGYCDDRSVRCWLDGKSVAKAIQNKGIQNQTLAEIEKISQQNLAADGFYADDKQVTSLKGVYEAIIEKINVPTDVSTVAYSGAVVLDYNGITYAQRTFPDLKTDIQALDKKLIFSKDRAELWFAEAQLNDKLAQKLYTKSQPAKDESDAGIKTPATQAAAVSQYRIQGQSIQISGDGSTWIDTGLTRSADGIRYPGIALPVSTIKNGVISRSLNLQTSSLPNGVMDYLNDINLGKINADGTITLAKAGTASVPGAVAPIVVDNTAVVTPAATITDTVDSAKATILAKMIQGEEGSQIREVKIAAGWVAMNRLQSEEFGATMEEVITAENQFQGYKASLVPTAENLQIAKDILNGNIADNTNDATFFVNSKLTEAATLSLFLKCGVNKDYIKLGTNMYVFYKNCPDLIGKV